MLRGNTFQLLKYTIVTWMSFYTLYVIFTNFLFIEYENVPWIVVPLILLYFGLYKHRLQRPAENLVEEFFGPIQNQMEKVGESSPKIDVIAHRGACLDAPENSKSAFRLCKNHHCQAVEFDVSYTKDYVPVLFHDEELDRITNSTGMLSDITFEELRKLEIGLNSIYGNKFANERILTLTEGIQQCLDLDLKMFIDLKSPSNRSVSVIVELYHRFPVLFRKAVVTSFYPHLIYQIRCIEPRIICCLAWRPNFLAFSNYDGIKGQSQPRFSSKPKHYLAVIADYLIHWLFIHCFWDFLGLSAVLLHKDILNLELIRYYHNKNIRVLAWTVNSPLEKLFVNNVLQIPYFTDTLIGDKVLEGRQVKFKDT